jgi:putative transposase
MRKSKFSESQIVGILKEAESGIPVADLLRRHGVSKATFFKWRSKYAGATVNDVKRLRELEAENTKLKRMYADLALENAKFSAHSEFLTVFPEQTPRFPTRSCRSAILSDISPRDIHSFSIRTRTRRSRGALVAKRKRASASWCSSSTLTRSD